MPLDSEYITGITEVFKKIAFIEGTQKKIANKLGVSQAAVSCWKLGKAKISFEMCLKIRRLYDIDIKNLRPDLDLTETSLNGSI